MAGSLTFTGSNRLEKLCDELAAGLRGAPVDPFVPEIIVVQSRGMERWLRLELARPGRLGVSANLRFPFPNAFLAELLNAVFPDRYSTALYERDALTFRILRLLPELRDDPRFAAASAYLERGESGDDVRLYRFARAVSETLDGYLTYRPDLVLGWEEGRDDHWQAELWRELTRDVRERGEPESGRTELHRGRLRELLIERFRDQSEPLDALPFGRVFVFGVSVLPPFHLTILKALSSRVDVQLLLMNPSRAYWSLVTSDRQKARLTRREAEAYPGREEPSPAELALETGNSLLASLGRLGGVFFDLVLETDPEEQSFFEEPAPDTLLHRIQRDILDMVDRGRPGEGEGEGEEPRHELPELEHSLSVHSCHSPIREAEVLHDHLLELFDRRPELTPGDVLVMTPDIETYAPAIQAVFETAEDERQRIPLSVSDRPLLAQTGLARTVFRILELPESRCAATELLALISDRHVRERFGMESSDPELIQRWVRDAGIRWGLDERHRADLGLPATRANTWAAGLDRLLLGSALSIRAAPSAGEAIFRGILPTDGPEGSEAAALGRLAELFDEIGRARGLLSSPRSPVEWPGVIREVLGALLGDAMDAEGDAEVLGEALRGLERSARSAAAHSITVGIGAMRAALERALQDERSSGRFLNGRLTVCEMLPMRSIPAEVICLVGMNDGSFPRRSRPPDFDLMAREPRRGDRSLVAEDRYLFLETILSARSELYLSYVGQSIRDNSAVTPAVPVSLLLDYAEQARGAGVRERLVVKHPLQPWSPRLLRADSGVGGPPPFTYSRRAALASRVLVTQPKSARTFCPQPLAPQQEPAVSLQALGRFLRNPARHLVRRRLGFTLEEPSRPAEDREPFVLDGLARYRIGDGLLGAYLRAGGDGSTLESAALVYRAAGELPHGGVGELQFAHVARDVQGIRNRLERRRTGEGRLEVPMTIELEGARVEAVLPALFAGCSLLYRWGKARAVDRLDMWLFHLAACAAGLLEEPWSTVFVALDGTLEMKPVDDARERLQRLLGLYREGSRRPLPFFPETSLAYYTASRTAASRVAIARARALWEPSPWSRSESEDPYFSQCFGADPLDDEFAGLALEVYSPLLAALGGAPEEGA